ncbi:hypothetical protein scyTo_0018713, partial [Scyliorhinus torazame]|nr:hypothetical protein [Scyliorhinus torazame]
MEIPSFPHLPLTSDVDTMSSTATDLDNMDVQRQYKLSSRWENSDTQWEEEHSTSKLFESSRIKALADERDAVQKKTFTKWMNSHLARVLCRVTDMYVDLRDGCALTKLLEVLSGEQLVLDKTLEIGQIIARYETLASALLEWIEQTIALISNQRFANSLTGVQQQLQAFTAYCTVEKPLKFEEKGNLEVLLFTIQSKLRANNQKLYLPHEGKLISDINRAWERLERAEHEREVALRNELIRQEKLEQLAHRFDHKAAMRETWLNENHRLISQVICNRVHHVNSCLEELHRLALCRRTELDGSRCLWAFFQEMEEVESWIHEKDQVISSANCGKDLNSATILLSKHKNLMGELVVHFSLLTQTITKGEQILAQKHFGTGNIQERILEVRVQWKTLDELAVLRQQRLQEALSFFQFKADTDDLEMWLQDAYRIVSSDDFGHDEYSTQSLAKKHRGLLEDIGQHRQLVQGLRSQAMSLAPEYLELDEVQSRVSEVEALYSEVKEVAGLRRQWLQDALAVYRMFSEVNACEHWIDEKEQWLNSMDIPDTLEDLELVQQRFESLDQEMNSMLVRVVEVNELVQQLVENGHPSATEVQGCQDHLNS